MKARLGTLRRYALFTTLVTRREGVVEALKREDLTVPDPALAELQGNVLVSFEDGVLRPVRAELEVEVR